MTKIINMGRGANVDRAKQFSDSFNDTYNTVAGMREKIRSNKANEKLKESSLSSELASQELRKREQDIANVRKTHDTFSSWWNDMEPQEQAIARSSDQYKEMQKFFKGFKDLVPGLMSDTGDIVSATNKDLYRRSLDEGVAKAKLNLAAGKATREDIMLIQAGDVKLDKLSEAIAKATTRIKKTEGKAAARDKAKIGSWTSHFFKALMNPKANASTEELSRPQITQPQQPVAPTNPNTNALSSGANTSDPLGILGR